MGVKCTLMQSHHDLFRVIFFASAFLTRLYVCNTYICVCVFMCRMGADDDDNVGAAESGTSYEGYGVKAEMTDR